MAVLVTSKSGDISACRAAGEFGADFRQALLERSVSCRSEEAEGLFDEACQALETLAAANDERVARLERIVDQTAASADPVRLGELCDDFYAELYDHFGCYGSAVAFYHFSTHFLHALAGSLHRYALKRLGPSGKRLPDMMPLALGPAGRREFSPFCPLQVALVFGRAANGDLDEVSRYCDILQEGFATCGLRVNGDIALVNSSWRGSLPEWSRRLEQGLARGKRRELVELLRWADHEALLQTPAMEGEFRALVLSQLQQSRRAIGDLVSRLLDLSNGLGIMGGWRLERGGPYSGLFRLFEHGLLPLSATVTALALINRVDAVEIPQRIRALLVHRALDVDAAERLLQSWHTLNELRLMREREMFPGRDSAAAMYLDVAALDEKTRLMLREALETIDNVQRRVSAAYRVVEE
ncbi:putative nucleotidyltransferase substrate binding domain-containing protein [Geobacter sp. AOG2]|uniref:putative nucleotidyltransferase substrate binding domain-containing protein n=1 Tax=Geobacter sp. AOG2 TaxID=1566347 RepID=UPI001CC778F5|nr:putative nucleotidyltransferase substrate binding domain-containing protein [Geobacter sp. AOG2]GFE60190.1 nucleotidyltransferase [Geobacter sp. AOG2]